MSTELKEDQKIKLKKPKLFAVYLLNDDFTTFEFVVFILTEIFDKSIEEAEQLTMKVHNDKKALAGIYTKEIAELKKEEVFEYASLNGFPFRADIEELE